MMPYTREVISKCGAFSCGNMDLDDFFFNDVFLYSEEMLGTTILTPLLITNTMALPICTSQKILNVLLSDTMMRTEISFMSWQTMNLCTQE